MGQSQSGTAAATAEAPSGAAAAVSGGCPVMQRNRSGKAGAELDPKNQMPAQPNQQPAPGQTRELPTERVPSTIPQADGQTKWVYPSPQMFYNALHRKGKATGEEEAHMEAVVAIHNNMNERTWRQILEWEQKYHSDCAHPSLARFVGRPDDLSVEARVRYWRTGDRPFDRHDWFVNRCGREVRYIIDYYDRPEQHAHDQLPSLHDETSVKSIELNVRCASPSARRPCLCTRRRRAHNPRPIRSTRAPAPHTARPQSGARLSRSGSRPGAARRGKRVPRPAAPIVGFGHGRQCSLAQRPVVVACVG